MGRKPTFTDSGGASPGKARIRKDGNSEMYRCEACHKDQVESVLARSRSARIRCRHCGQVIYPVTQKEEETLGRTCLYCFTTLRSTNKDPVCSLCLRKVSREGKLKAVLYGGKYIHATFGDSVTTTWCDRKVKNLDWGERKVDCPICIRRSNRATEFPGRPLPHASIIGKPPAQKSPPAAAPTPAKTSIYASLILVCERIGADLERRSNDRASAAHEEWLTRNQSCRKD